VSELLRLAALAEKYTLELLQSQFTKELHLRVSMASPGDAHTVFSFGDICYAFNDGSGTVARVGELTKTLIVKWYLKYAGRMYALGPCAKLPYDFLAATSETHRKNAENGILPKDITFECEAVKFDPFANCPPCPAFGSSAAAASIGSPVVNNIDSQTSAGVQGSVTSVSKGPKVKLKSVSGGTAARLWHVVPKVGKFDHYVHMDNKFSNRFQTLTARPQLSSWSIEELRLATLEADRVEEWCPKLLAGEVGGRGFERSM